MPAYPSNEPRPDGLKDYRGFIQPAVLGLGDDGDVIQTDTNLIVVNINEEVRYWLQNRIPPAGFDIPGIIKVVRETLAKPDCAAFTKAMLDGVAKLGHPVYPAGGNLSDVFEAFLNQKPHTLFTRNSPNGSAGVANPIGNIKSGNGAIYMSGYATGLQTLFDADATIGELFHLAGQGRWYSDKELATVLHSSSYAAQAESYIAPNRNVFDPRYKAQNGETKANQLAYSGYFHTIQHNSCHVLPGTHTLR